MFLHTIVYKDRGNSTNANANNEALTTPHLADKQR